MYQDLMSSQNHGKAIRESITKRLEKVPKPLGSPDSAYKIALDCIGNRSGLEILDLPAGEGAFTQILINHGYRVQAGDLFPSQFKIPEIECHRIDINEPFPHSDYSFDGVVCMNGIHRVWARGQAIHQMCRILKPNGLLVLSFPSSTLFRRLLYLLIGSITSTTLGPPAAFVPNETPALSYRNNLPIAHILEICRAVGFDVVKVKGAKPCWKSILVCPLSIPQFLIKALSGKRSLRQYWIGESNSIANLFYMTTVLVLRKK